MNGFFSRRTKARPSSRVRLQVEELEARRVMAGNVSASLVNGTLTITGDAAANGIGLIYWGDRWELTGHALEGSGTTINGSNSPVSFTAPVRNLVIRLGDGNDGIGINQYAVDAIGDWSPPNTNLSSFELDLGAGNDNAGVQWLTASQALVEARAGNDFVGFTSSTLGNAVIRLGAGDNNLRMHGRSDNVLIEGHISSDDIRVSGVGNLVLHTGHGADFVQLGGSVGTATIYLGEHDDRFETQRLSGASLIVDAAGGDDSFSLVDVAMSGTVRLLGGSGNEETVEVVSKYDRNAPGATQKLTIGGDLVIDLGEGDDGNATTSPAVSRGVYIGTVLANSRTEDFFIGGQLRILGGGGNDGMELSTFSAGSVLVNMGPGDSALVMNAALVRGDVTIGGGEGRDAWELNAFGITGHLTLNSGAGNDAIRLNTLLQLPSDVQGNLLINAGAGMDLVTTGIRFTEGPGDPNISRLIVHGTARVNGGVDNDHVSLAQFESRISLFAALGDGDDFLHLLFSEAPQGNFSGGLGTDVISGANEGGNEFGQVSKSGFESEMD